MPICWIPEICSFKTFVSRYSPLLCIKTLGQWRTCWVSMRHHVSIRKGAFTRTSQRQRSLRVHFFTIE
jgi:hypothetical protein